MQETINPNIYNIFEKAKQCSNNKNFDLALKYFDGCIKYKSLKNDVLFEEIKIFYELKDYAKAIKHIKIFLKLKTDKQLRNTIKIFLAKSYKALGEIDKAVIVLDSIDVKYIKEHFVEFSRERIDVSFFKFSDFFRVQEFSGDLKKLQKEFESLKKLHPQNKKQLFYLSRVSNFLHNYGFTKKLINTYVKNFNYKDIFYDNAILNEFEIANRDVVLKSKPRNMWIATSSKCNIKCKMCAANDANWSLSNKNIEDIYSYMPYLEQIVWWGGEPTISKTFYEMLNYSLKYKHIKHTIITNGQYMPQKLINIISDNNIEVIFSIDSVNKKKYEEIRKGASFDRLTENLSKLSKTTDANLIKFNVVAMKNTISEIDKIFNFAKKYKIKAISFIPLCGDRMIDDKLTDMDIIAINKISKKFKKLKIFHSINMLKKDTGKYKPKGFCHIPWSDITISYMGFLCNDNNCSFFGEKIYKLTESNMGEYWNSDIIKNMRKYILKNHYCSRYCPKVSRNIL